MALKKAAQTQTEVAQARKKRTNVEKALGARPFLSFLRMNFSKEGEWSGLIGNTAHSSTSDISGKSTSTLNLNKNSTI